MKILNSYKNGNALITLFEDGTRIIDYPDNEKLNVDYPLSIDLCICKKCPYGCQFCYNNSTPNGKLGDIMGLKFIDTMVAGEEVAIGGGSVTQHPDLKPFLRKLKDKGLIANITVSQSEFIDEVNTINDLIEEELIHGLGVSFKEPNDLLYKSVCENDNCIVHLIAGVHGKDVFDYLSKFNAKVLILGYKDLQRGALYRKTQTDIDEKIEWLRDNLEAYIDKFALVSLDNLAIKQLNPQGFIKGEDWEHIYQGDDGNISFYVDAVEGTCHQSSLETKAYELKDDIKEMFKMIKESR